MPDPLREGSLSEGPFDVAIVGAGAVGCAVAREVSRRGARCVLLEAGPDVGAGASKENTAILHTGFDAKPGTIEARLVARGYELLLEYAALVGIPTARLGALMVAWTAAQSDALPGIEANAKENGYEDARPVELQELYAREPNLGPGAQGALEIPGEGIVCPFTTTLAFATEALASGCELALRAAVRRAEFGATRSMPSSVTPTSG
jgi:glycerol-3-phosphate dehydrogenase